MSALGETEMKCREIRDALDAQHAGAAVEAHIENCPACADARRMTVAVRSALLVEAPAELSARLLALAAPAPRPSRLDVAVARAVVLPVPPHVSRRLQRLVLGAAAQPVRRPWIMPVYGATALLLGVLLVVAAQIYGLALQELGVGDVWRGIAQLPGEWLDRLYVLFPQGRYVVEAFFSLQRALQWVLVGLLMWAVLEMRIRRPAGGQQAAISS